MKRGTESLSENGLHRFSSNLECGSHSGMGPKISPHKIEILQKETA
jgi:hypothetical protein